MPLDSKVHLMYAAMVREGMDKAEAAKIAQARTGLALRTGQPIKAHKAKLKFRGGKHGLYG